MSISKAGTFRNILYTGLGRGLSLICSGVTSFVLARNLGASDYGVVGFATIVIGFLVQFSDMGIANATIRRPELRPRDIDTAFTLKVFLGCLAFLIALLVAPFSHYLLNHPATANVIRLLALNFFISTVGFVPQVLLTREMDFRTLMVPGMISTVVQSALAVVLVLYGWSFWSVVIANIGGALTTGIALQFARRVPMRFGFDRKVAREYLRFGLPLFGSGVLIFIIFNLDNFLVGAAMGSVQLGYYAIAFTWGAFICGLLTATVNNVLFPAFSAIKDDAAASRRWYLKTVELVAFIAVVFNGTLFANAQPFLVTFLGKGTDKWLPAMLSLQILCVYGILRALTETMGPCIMALGATKVLFRANLLMGVVEIGLLMLALRSGKVELVALGVFIAYACAGIVLLPFLRKEFSVTIGDLAIRLWPIIPACFVGWLATALLANSFGNTFLSLCERGLFTASAIAVIHGCLSRFRCFSEISGMISQQFARSR